MTGYGMPPRKKPRRIEERLAALKAIDPAAPEALAELREALRSASGILIAAAARLTAEHRLEALAPVLADASRLAARGSGAARSRLPRQDRDRAGCTSSITGTIACSSRASRSSRRKAGVSRTIWLPSCAACAASRTRTLAATTRSRCSPICSRIPSAPRARIAAAQGLGDAGRPDAAALLRYKVRVGDPEPEVITACVESLLQLARGRAEGFLIGLLGAMPTIAPRSPRSPSAGRSSPARSSRWSRGATACLPAQRHRIGYLALALLRHEPARPSTCSR